MQVKHVSSVTSYHQYNKYLPNVMKISAKINTAKYQHFTLCSFTVLNELKERSIVAWSDFRQLNCAESVSRHVSVQMVDILNTFRVQTLANN